MANGAPEESSRLYLEALKRHHSRNSCLFYLDGFFFLFGLAMVFPSTVLAGYVAHFSESASAPAVLTMLFLVGFALPQPLGGYISQRRHSRKMLVFWLGVVQRTPILLLALFSMVAHDHTDIALPVIYVVFGLFSFSCGLISPVWIDWIGRVLDPRRRGRSLGFRTFWMSLGGLLGALFTSLMLDDSEGHETYQVLFWVAYVSMMLTLPCMYFTVEMDYPVRTAPRSFGQFMGQLATVLRSNKPFRRYVLSMTLCFCTTIVPGIGIWYARQRFEVSEGIAWNPNSAAGRWNLWMWLVQAVLGLGMSRFVQRHGPRPAVAIMGFSAIAMPVAAMFATSPGMFSLVFISFGVFQSAFFVGHLGTIYALAPGEDRLPYLAVAELFKVPVVLATVLGGAFLIDHGDASTVTWVMAVSIVAPVVGLLLMPEVPKEG